MKLADGAGIELSLDFEGGFVGEESTGQQTREVYRVDRQVFTRRLEVSLERLRGNDGKRTSKHRCMLIGLPAAMPERQRG